MSVICSACGQQWQRHPALEVPCPQCGAAEGRHCIRPSEHSGPLVTPHIPREQLAVDRGLLELCSKGPTRKAGKKNLGHESSEKGDELQPTLIGS